MKLHTLIKAIVKGYMDRFQMFTRKRFSFLTDLA